VGKWAHAAIGETCLHPSPGHGRRRASDGLDPPEPPPKIFTGPSQAS